MPRLAFARPAADATATARRPRARRLRPLLAWGAVAVALAATFAAYLNPHLALELANQAWACF